MPVPRENEAGSALVISLWGIALMGFLVSLAVRDLREINTDTRVEIASAQASALADGAVAIVRARLATAKWAPADARPNGPGWVCSLPGNALAIIWVDDETGKLNLNAASVEDMTTLLVRVGTPDERARQLAGDIVSFAKRPLTGRVASAEQGQSMTTGPEDGPKMAPFDTIYELDQVAGMTPELLNRLLPQVTVHAKGPKPDSEMTGAPDSQTLLRSGVGTVHLDVVTRAGSWTSREFVVALRESGRLPQILEWRIGQRRANGAPQSGQLDPC